MSRYLFLHIAVIVSLSLLIFKTKGYAQTIEYSVPLDDNIRTTNFNIIGNCGNHLMIYKKTYDKNEIAIYDTRMRILDAVPLNFLPKEIKQSSFINLGDKVMMIYQYSHRKEIHCDAVMLGPDAQPLTKPFPIHTTAQSERLVGENAYATIHSDDKSKTMVFQILRNEDSMYFRIRTFLLDSAMKLLSSYEMTVPSVNQSDQPANFTLSDDGHLYFTIGIKSYEGKPYFQQVSLYCLTPRHILLADTVRMNAHFPKDPVLLTLDETHGKLWVFSLNYGDKSRNINYLSVNCYNKDSLRYADFRQIPFTDSLKENIRDKKSGRKQTFNNYQVTGGIIDKEGNALLTAEERYKDSHGDNHYDNVLFIDLNSSGRLMQMQKIEKSQGADLTDVFSSYLMINTGLSLHFLTNKSHRIFRFLNNYVYLLSDYRYNAEHQLKEMPVMRGLDSKKRWAPRYGKQISRNEVVIPCVTASSLIFGKITYLNNKNGS